MLYIGHCPHLWNPLLEAIHHSQQSYCLWHKCIELSHNKLDDFDVQAEMVAGETCIYVGNILSIFYDCLYEEPNLSPCWWRKRQVFVKRLSIWRGFRERLLTIFCQTADKFLSRWQEKSWLIKIPQIDDLNQSYWLFVDDTEYPQNFVCGLDHDVLKGKIWSHLPWS